MRGVATWADLLFRFALLPTLMLWAARELWRNIQLLWKEMTEGGAYRW